MFYSLKCRLLDTFYSHKVEKSVFERTFYRNFLLSKKLIMYKHIFTAFWAVKSTLDLYFIWVLYSTCIDFECHRSIVLCRGETNYCHQFNLGKENLDRKEMGRDKFLSEVWKWKDFSEERIQSQIKRLGSSVDWNKYRFTLDDGFTKAVNKAFIELYRKDKIYRAINSVI